MTHQRVRVRSLGALLAVMCAALALVIGAGSSLALALPDLARDTGASQTELTWAVNVYALTFAGLLLPLGIAADRYGRRGALLLGLAVFAGASLASGLVADPVALVVLRALAGAGAAAVMPATLSVLVGAFPAERRGTAIGIWAAVSGAGALLGLLLAGVLLEFAWWGSVQLVFGGLSAAVLLLSALVVPASSNPDLHLDPLGGLLALLGLGGLVYGIVEGPSAGGPTRPPSPRWPSAGSPWSPSSATSCAAGTPCSTSACSAPLRSPPAAWWCSCSSSPRSASSSSPRSGCSTCTGSPRCRRHSRWRRWRSASAPRRRPGRCWSAASVPGPSPPGAWRRWPARSASSPSRPPGAHRCGSSRSCCWPSASASAWR